MSELSKAYAPNEVEQQWYARWTQAGCFTADAASAKPAYSIVIPPPNVTGMLHLGHVLNNTIQDVLARRARQEGKEVLWLPGTDHAGIATQTQVEKMLRRTENKSRRDLGREEFLKRVWQWKDQYGGIIIQQLKRLGASCDWSRERFTMDEGYSKAVQGVFVKLFQKGLIYRGLRMVNWCPVSLTALSDEEVIPTPQKGKFYTMRYEVVEEPGRFLEISTTRPETLMGDTAVAVNPADERHADLIGKHVWRPFPREAIPVIGDAAVDKEFGTGALKVTPAHDKVDFEIGQRHKLPVRDVLHPDGKINCPECPDLDGLDRFVARKKAAEKLAEMELLVKEEDYQNNVGFSERAGVPIEPRLSLQWFLKYPSVKETAESVETDAIRMRPERWKKTFAHWMGGLQDWCISRQLWWGHRIPVWYRKDIAEALQARPELASEAVAAGEIHVGVEPPSDPENWVQDEDSLDTWFSSWLWPYETMDEATRAKFYPTSDLVTGPDIIFFWVARMIMAGYEFMGELPFRNVYFTGIIRDKFGRKMSKTLGNSPDPIMLMDYYGADALRFGIMRLAPEGTDVIFNDSVLTKNQQGTKEDDNIEKDDRFPQIMLARNFCTKLWNACRFRQMQGPCGEFSVGSLQFSELSDFHIDILARLDALQANHAAWYADYDFNKIAQSLSDFFWGEFCDQFLEAVKTDTRPDSDPASKAVTLRVIDTVLQRYLQLLSPFMPHVAEELWEKLGFATPGEFLMTRPLDTTPLLAGLEAAAVSAAQSRAREIYESASRVRNLKAACGLGARRDLRFILKPAETWAAEHLPVFKLLCAAGEMDVQPEFAGGKGNAATLTPAGHVFLPLEGLIDIDAERTRLTKEREKCLSEAEKASAKLKDEKFTARAPKEVITEHEDRVRDFTEKAAQLQELLDNLS